MRHVRLLNLARLLAAIGAGMASPAFASTWQIGPAIGFDVFTSSNSSSTLTVVAAPMGPDLFTSGVRPGLRVGAWDASMRHELFSDIGYYVISGSGSSVHTASWTLNYAHAFGQGSAPYVTVGGGFATVGGDSFSSESFTLFGLGVGHRQRLAHGHGSIRVEGRYDRINPSESFADDLGVIGFRVGFDLDLN